VVDVLHIHLDLRPDVEKKRLDAVCTTRVRAIEDGVARIVLDAVDLEVASVVRTTDRAPLAFRASAEKLELTIEPPLRAGDELEFAVEYAVRNPRRGIYFIER
jgi:aminopeptidase N